MTTKKEGSTVEQEFNNGEDGSHEEVVETLPNTETEEKQAETPENKDETPETEEKEAEEEDDLPKNEDDDGQAEEKPEQGHDVRRLFKATVSNPKKFQTIFDIASTLVDEVTIKIDKDGLSIRAIDTGHVGFLICDMTRPFFSRFRTNEIISWNVSLVDISKILKRSKATDTLEISHTEDDEQNLYFRIIQGKRTRVFKLRQKELTDASLDSQKMDDGTSMIDVLKAFEAKVKEASLGQFTLETDFLEDLVKDAEMISDVMDVDIDLEKEMLKFSAEETTSSNVTELKLSDKEQVLSAKVEDDCHGRYALNYLDTLLKLKNVVESFKILIGKDSPMYIEAKFLRDEGTLAVGDPGSIRYILAPRIERDEPEADPDEAEAPKKKRAGKKGGKKADKKAAKQAESEDDSDADESILDEE
jgi:DNA polymerase III sliding clamp (beta) subunit (PCNA family)